MSLCRPTCGRREDALSIDIHIAQTEIVKRDGKVDIAHVLLPSLYGDAHLYSRKQILILSFADGLFITFYEPYCGHFATFYEPSTVMVVRPLPKMISRVERVERVEGSFEFVSG